MKKATKSEMKRYALMDDPIFPKRELEDIYDAKSDEGRRKMEDLRRIQEEMQKHVSPKGALRLEPLLDARRLRVGIPDGAFTVPAAFDRCVIWQVDRGDGIHAKGSTTIHLTDIRRERDQESAPRGILCSAGLRALDELRSNGIDLGHVVAFTRLAPVKLPSVWYAGKEAYVSVINAGDIVGSEDVGIALRMGLMTLKRVEREVDGVWTVEHVYADENGRTYAPNLPWRGKEY